MFPPCTASCPCPSPLPRIARLPLVSRAPLRSLPPLLLLKQERVRCYHQPGHHVCTPTEVVCEQDLARVNPCPSAARLGTARSSLLSERGGDGQVTSGAVSPINKTNISMGYIKKPFNKKGTEIQVRRLSRI